MDASRESGRILFYTRRQWRIAFLLFTTYCAAYGAVMILAPASAALYPAAGIGIAALFFGGLALWPIVLIASVASGFFFGVPQAHILTITLADVSVAVVGAWLLHKSKLDPLFRKYSDMFALIAAAAIASLIFPTLDAIERILTGAPYMALFWGRHYAGMLLSLLVITPFILRWCAKPRFSRHGAEIIETIGIFILLLILNVSIFVFDITAVFGIFLIYILLFPLFWIALRLRPRFMTLALLITSLFAIWNSIAHSTAGAFGAQLFSNETFLITLSVIFLIIVSLEEDRRLHTNLMRSQLSTLENALARISSESQAKNDFIAVLAHELRNPLAPVVSAIDYLKISAPRDAEEMETLDMMDSRMKIVRRLLDDLLDVSRISEGKMTVKTERVNLDTIIRRAILSTEHHVKERHQTLTYKEAPKDLFVSGDQVRLEQIFSNLITNASKYSDSGDPITLSARKNGGYAEIMIQDRGVGILPETIDHIFTPFHQVGSGKRTQMGLGIGLALVQSFVQVHGGTVVAFSEGKDRGSTFTVKLPLLHEDTNIAKGK